MNRLKKMLTITLTSVMALGCFGTTVMAEENVWGIDVNAMPVYEDLNGSPADDPYVELWGQNRYETAAKVAREAFAADHDTVDKAVLASSGDFADALAANGLAGRLDCPLMLCYKNSMSAETEDLMVNFFGNGATTNIKTLYVSGGVFSEDVINRLREIGVEDLEIMAGEDRYETACMIAEQIRKINGTAPDKKEAVCFVASGRKSADALSVSPISYAQAAPILLTNGSSLTDATKENLSHYNHVYILGGTAAVTQGVKDTIKGIVGSEPDVVQRLYGESRYLTAAHINNEFTMNPSALICAYNAVDTDFPDALASGMLARLTDPVLNQYTVAMLVKPSNTSWQNYITNHIFVGQTRNIYLVGGKTVQSPLLDKIKAAVNAEHNGDES